MRNKFSSTHEALAKHLNVNPEWIFDASEGTAKDEIFHFVYSVAENCKDDDVQTYSHCYDVWEVDEDTFAYTASFCYDANRPEIECVDVEKSNYAFKEKDYRKVWLDDQAVEVDEDDED